MGSDCPWCRGTGHYRDYNGWHRCFCGSNPKSLNEVIKEKHDEQQGESINREPEDESDEK